MDFYICTRFPSNIVVNLAVYLKNYILCPKDLVRKCKDMSLKKLINIIHYMNNVKEKII